MMARVGVFLLWVTCAMAAFASSHSGAHRYRKSRRQSTSTERKVFAHYMVGLTSGQERSQWETDISQASAVGIDGFALNFGPSDSWTNEQLSLAYEVAAANSFLLFLSFDFAAGEFGVQAVVDLVNSFKDSPAQFKVDGAPLVSTFEGPNWKDNWEAVRKDTGDIFLCPDWSSLGPEGIKAVGDTIDGAFSWEAWPKAGEKTKTLDSDLAYIDALEGKLYMMGVSPYFYTNLPQYNKNWYSSSERLWWDRWEHVLEVLPDIVQIISWNDFGESHYISDIVDRQIVDGAGWYVKNHDHSAFRTVLPYFIKAYKEGTREVVPPNGNVALAWYRTTNVKGRTAGDTVWGQGGTQPAAEGADDVVSVLVISEKPTVVTLMLGGEKHNMEVSNPPVAFFQFPLPAHGGEVILAMDGEPTEGPPIQSVIDLSTPVDFNCVAISVPEVGEILR